MSLCWAVLLWAAGCATQGPAAGGAVVSAKVSHQQGSARCRAGGSDWQPLQAGDLVKPGTMIQTATNSRLDLVLSYGSAPGAGSTVRLRENTLLSLDKLAVLKTGADVATDTQLDLKAGHIHGVLRKLSAGSQYEVKIPNGVASIRGTGYDISAKGDVKVFAGSVSLAYVGSDGKAVTQLITGSPSFGAPNSSLEPWRNWPPSRRF